MPACGSSLVDSSPQALVCRADRLETSYRNLSGGDVDRVRECRLLPGIGFLCGFGRFPNFLHHPIGLALLDNPLDIERDEPAGSLRATRELIDVFELQPSSRAGVGGGTLARRIERFLSVTVGRLRTLAAAVWSGPASMADRA
jgi:hypothetical protein